MPKFTRWRRTFAAAASTLAIAAGCTFAIAPAAHASGCTIINIGSPGSIYVGSEYAGQVEQQYDSCGNARAHFQYSYSYWINHRGSSLPSNWSANPCIMSSGYYESCNETNTIQGPQDAYSPWVGIHIETPDTWQAIVTIPISCASAAGSWHAYADGSNWGNYDSPDPC